MSGASQPEQAFKAAQPSYRDEPPKQRSTDGRLCDLCVTNEGELVETSGAWRQALWLAEKHIITRVQTLVQSPILARYAAAAYRLRQKPLGVCCLSCQQWVWESSVGPPSTGTFFKNRMAPGQGLLRQPVQERGFFRLILGPMKRQSFVWPEDKTVSHETETLVLPGRLVRFTSRKAEAKGGR